MSLDFSTTFPDNPSVDLVLDSARNAQSYAQSQRLQHANQYQRTRIAQESSASTAEGLNRYAHDGYACRHASQRGYEQQFLPPGSCYDTVMQVDRERANLRARNAAATAQPTRYVHGSDTHAPALDRWNETLEYAVDGAPSIHMTGSYNPAIDSSLRGDNTLRTQYTHARMDGIRNGEAQTLNIRNISERKRVRSAYNHEQTYHTRYGRGGYTMSRDGYPAYSTEDATAEFFSNQRYGVPYYIAYNPC